MTTQSVTVASLSCPNCDDATTAADFWVKDATGTQVWVHVPNTWQATWNVKKQNFVPAVGQTVVVQGVVGYVSSQFMITMKRFAEIGHTGPTVHAYDIAAGSYPTGSYAWLAPVTVLNRGHWDDGDYSWDVRDPAGGGLVHVELSPPYVGQLRLPNMGETVRPFGQVRFDPDHNWWELHPVRCWSDSECVPSAASDLVNGPPPGTPLTTSTSTGWYEQGGPEPLWVPVQSSGTPPNQGAFGSTFSPTGNEWWVQTTISATKTIVGVDAVLNGGAPTPLTYYSWGGWAKSIHAPSGTIVRFVAHDDIGETATSPCYQWTAATSVACPGGSPTPPPPPSPPPSSPPPTNGSFTASFTPSKNGNDWWVESSVAANAPLAGVDARVNNGAWTPLTHESWGSWAKSIHAPAGSTVEFQARDSAGDAVVSQKYIWPVR